MGQTKRHLEALDQLHQDAIAVCVEVGVLGQCDLHEDMVWDKYGDRDEAYELAYERLSGSDALDDDDERASIREAIDEAIDSAGIECAICAAHAAS